MLFFDEADALFGKRSDVKDAHDRYANQEVSYLLQRIEKFDGLTILASNFENNMDDAFKRRIDVSVNVIRPTEITRRALWEHYLPQNITFESEELLKHLTKEYAYTGANIRNIMKNVAMALHDRNETSITYSLISTYLMIENEKAFGKNQSRLSPYVQTP
jgi:SpoVK/Ycf46/Vps4 family AAA+-type ATPase